MKIPFLFALIIASTIGSKAQQQEVNFPHQQIDFSAAPRTSMTPMSIKLWDNYSRPNAPSTYGTVLEIYGQQSHQTGQLYFGGWDDSKIRYREAFYNQGTWSSWQTILDSKNNVESTGRLMVSGQGSHYLTGGNVGIGTTSPTEKLSVNGNIRAKEIKVEVANWPDYVFEDGYKLSPLDEIEKFIAKYKRLPDMPSAKQVEADGIDLGAMNALLLKKQEEMMLLLIEQNKEMKRLSKEVCELKNKSKNEK